MSESVADPSANVPAEADADAEGEASESERPLGFVAVHPESGFPFCYDEDAAVLLADAKALQGFIKECTEEEVASEWVQQVSYEDVVEELLHGGVFAFDKASYALFVEFAAADGFETPPFDDIAGPVEQSDLRLAVLEYELEDDLLEGESNSDSEAGEPEPGPDAAA